MERVYDKAMQGNFFSLSGRKSPVSGREEGGDQSDKFRLIGKLEMFNGDGIFREGATCGWLNASSSFEFVLDG